MLTAAVSGSFHRHMEAITTAVHELAERGVRVLSPADPRIVAQQGEFLFVASDVLRSVRLVQDRHLESIKAATFLWLVCPDGYVGQSASMEIGYAAAVGVPIFSSQVPTDLTLRQYVKRVPNLATAISWARTQPLHRQAEGILIDPRASVEKAHRLLDRIGVTLGGRSGFDEPAISIGQDLASLRTHLRLPTHTH